jgi:pilus assembly protein Flp/PilA
MSFQGQTGNVWKGCEVKTFINLMTDQSGASAAEYALILAIVGGAIALAAVALGGSISNSMKKAGNCINAGSNSTAVSANCP